MKETGGESSPLVSVVMPSYNCEKYIGEAIESVLNQTYKNWELIIIEDGSADNSLEIIQNYRDKRIKLLCNELNRGIADATNRGIKESAGRYVALLDDDDIAEKNRLELQVNYLENHAEIDILGGRTTFINESGEVIDYSGVPRNNPKYIRAVLLFNCMDFLNGTAMIRKEFVEKHHLHYENGCYGMQDYKFYIESSKVGNISSINRFLLKHRLHNGNETDRNFRIFGKERQQTYARFQCHSLEKSGFCLTEDALALINKALSEKGGGCDSIQELQELYEIFCELLRQGERMKIDYLEELEHVCKTKMAEQLMKIENLFGNKKAV